LSLETAAANLAVVLGTLAAVALCVLLQYEYLVLVWRRLSRHTGHRRLKVLYAIFAVIFLHVLEVWILGTATWLLLLWPATGGLHGPLDPSFLECIYFSAVTFSTVGFGDVAPLGPIRFLAGTEALTGLVLITWSASFTYLEMERFWRPEDMSESQ